MKKQSPIHRHKLVALQAVILSAAIGMAAAHADAAIYTWGSSSSGNWSTAANWNPSTGTPGSADTAILDTTSADRTVTFDSATTTTTVNTLTLNQSDSYVNTLDIQKSLTVTNSFSLSATGGGTSRILIDPPTPPTPGTGAAYNTTLKIGSTGTGTVTLNSGGLLEMTAYRISPGTGTTGNIAQSTLTGNVVVSGGSLIADQGVSYSGSTDTMTATIGGNLTMSSGLISFGKAAPSGNAATYVGTTGYSLTQFDRLSVTGNLVITGGTLDAGSSNNDLYINGASSSITGLSGSVTPRIALYTTSLTSQSLLSDNTLSGGLLLRYQGNSSITYTIGSQSGGTLNVGQISLTNKSTASTGVTTLSLASDITSSYAPVLTGSNNTTPKFAIDTNGHTLDLTGAASGFSLPTVSTSTWTLANSNSTGSTGAIKAVSFNLSAPTGGSSVGAYANLIATGNGGKTNTLSNTYGGSIDATSTFIYNGTATTSNYDKLISSRTIGNLTVATGALQFGSAVTTGSGSTTTVASGATLNLGGYTLTTGKLASSGQIIGDLAIGSGTTVSTAGTPGTFGHTGTMTYAGGGTYQWFINDANGSQGSGFSTMAITGALNITATSANQFVIDLTSLSGTSAGNAANFDKTQNYSWVIASTTGGITGFDAANFDLLTNHFSNDLAGTFSLQTSQDGSSLDLVYTAATVPEPAALGILALGGGLWLGRRRR